MKRLMTAVTVLGLGFLAIATVGQVIPGDPGTYPSVSIVNTRHNLNTFPGVDIPGNQVCLPCHTPHNALKNGEANVLWNHAETGETFTMYSSSALGQPEGVSKMCLSCHDGVTAVDNYGGVAPGTPHFITGPKALGINLANDHPIAVEYPTGVPTEYNDPLSFAPGINSGSGVKLVEISGVQRVECTSCHQVHNNGLGHFLRVPIEESYLCLQCHIK